MNKLFGTLLTCAAVAASALPTRAAIDERDKTGGFAVSVQAYTFNRFSTFEAIDKTA